MFLAKRSFWTFARGKVTATVLAQEQTGYLFRHEQIKYRTIRTVTDIGEEYQGSLAYCKRHMGEDILGKQVNIEYEQHLIGVPWNGWVFDPIYIKHITVIN